MFVIDTNALIVLILGIINPKHFKTHKTASVYEEEDFEELLAFIGNINKLLIIPNVWTEVDNLLNNFSGDEKYEYIKCLINSITETTEQYIETKSIIEMHEFPYVGVTDSILLSLSKNNNHILITSDSSLSDYANANNILVYDMKEIKKNKLLRY